MEALTSDLVLQDLPEDAQLTCIIQHLGFNPVCLQKWRLRLGSHKCRTKGKKNMARQDQRKGEQLSSTLLSFEFRSLWGMGEAFAPVKNWFSYTRIHMEDKTSSGIHDFWKKKFGKRTIYFFLFEGKFRLLSFLAYSATTQKTTQVNSLQIGQ